MRKKITPDLEMGVVALNQFKQDLERLKNWNRQKKNLSRVAAKAGIPMCPAG